MRPFLPDDKAVTLMFVSFYRKIGSDVWDDTCSISLTFDHYMKGVSIEFKISFVRQ